MNKHVQLFALSNNEHHDLVTILRVFCNVMSSGRCLFGSFKLQNGVYYIVIVFKRATCFYGSLDGFI